MPEQHEILAVLNQNYPMRFDRVEFVRDSGSVAYEAFSGKDKYFLRITKAAFFDTAVSAVDIHVYLQKREFPVPPVIFTESGSPYVTKTAADGARLYILYAFIAGDEVDPKIDAERIGALVGQLHRVMGEYPGELVKRDKQFYVGRYIELLRKKQYARAEEFAAYGDALWGKTKALPRGYCHGDMYCGNFHKTPEGKIYILDFDTSCEGFPMYDPVLICNRTDYFQFKEEGYRESTKVFRRFLPEYLKYNTLTPEEIGAFYDLNALYHFALQATIIELFGMDSVDEVFLDTQLDWLYRWREQCERGG